MHGPLGYMHVVSATLALVFGGIVVLAPKGTGIHRLLGLLYFFSMLTVNMSALLIYDMTGHFGPFHVLALISLTYLMIALSAALLKPKDWLTRHVYWMVRSYMGLWAAAIAETLVRVPVFGLNTMRGGFIVGIGTAIAMLVAARIMTPRIKKVARLHLQQAPTR